MKKKQILHELDVDYDNDLINTTMTSNSNIYNKKVLDLTLKELLNLVKEQNMIVIIKLVDGYPTMSISSNENISKEKREFREDDIEPIVKRRIKGRFMDSGNFW